MFYRFMKEPDIIYYNKDVKYCGRAQNPSCAEGSVGLWVDDATSDGYWDVSVPLNVSLEVCVPTENK